MSLRLRRGRRRFRESYLRFRIDELGLGLELTSPEVRPRARRETKLVLEKLANPALLAGPIISPRPASPVAISNKSIDYRPARLAGWS